MRSIRLLCLLTLLPCCCLAGWAEESQSRHLPAPDEAVQDGCVIADGLYVAPPYVVRLDEHGLTVNNLPLELPVRTYGRYRMPQANPWAIGRGRMRVLQVLRGDGLVLVDGGKAILLGLHEATDLLEALLDEDLEQRDRIDAIVEAASHRLGSAEATRLLEQFQPDPRLREHLHRMRQKVTPRQENEQDFSINRTRLLSAFSLLISALALGTLIRQAPPRTRHWRGRDDSPESTRSVLHLVGLLAALNVLDLTCSLNATRAGTMLELNPLIRPGEDGAMGMVIFKIAALTLAVVVLVLLRRHRVSHLAAWWACALYAVVAMRWAAFGSMVV